MFLVMPLPVCVKWSAMKGRDLRGGDGGIVVEDSEVGGEKGAGGQEV